MQESEGRIRATLREVFLLLTSTLVILSPIVVSPALPDMGEFFSSIPNAETLVKLVITIPALSMSREEGLELRELLNENTTGTMTNICCESTARTAMMKDFNVMFCAGFGRQRLCRAFIVFYLLLIQATAIWVIILFSQT